MGSTYKPKRKGVEPFYADPPQRQLLASVHKAYGLPFSTYGSGLPDEIQCALADDGEDVESPLSTPRKADKAECTTWSDKINHDPRTFHQVAVGLMHNQKTANLWGGDVYGLAEFIEQWATFLENCNGFKRV